MLRPSVDASVSRTGLEGRRCTGELLLIVELP
jgi:hypothetical protein